MSKKVKCIECSLSMYWAMPEKVTEDNYEYAKHCLQTARRSIVCGETMKTKPINHEQYCKKYIKKTEREIMFDEFMFDEYLQKEISELERMIKEYEESTMTKCSLE